MFSPDGRWLAYSSGESGRQEVHVRPFPGPGGTWQISTRGGMNPTWSRTKHELFYAADGQIMVVRLRRRRRFVPCRETAAVVRSAPSDARTKPNVRPASRRRAVRARAGRAGDKRPEVGPSRFPVQLLRRTAPNCAEVTDDRTSSSILTGVFASPTCRISGTNGIEPGPSGPGRSIAATMLPALCGGPVYMRMRLERMLAEARRFEADRLKQYCASLPRQ